MSFREISEEEFHRILNNEEQKLQKKRSKTSSADVNTVGVGVNECPAENGHERAPQRRLKKERISPVLLQMLEQYNSPERLDRHPCMINVDKVRVRLEASVKDYIPGEEVRHLDNDVVLMPKNETGTMHHRCIWDVFYSGQLVGVLETGARLQNMAKYDYLLLNNDVIWQDGWSRDILPNVIAGLGTSFHSVANLDICIDGVNDIVQVFEMYQWTNSQTYKQMYPDSGRVVRPLKGGRKGVGAHFGSNKFNEHTGQFEHYYIGQKGADKRFVIYEKNQEITHMSPHKIYIRDAWNSAGMQVQEGDQVLRCELRLKGEQLDKFDIQDITQLEDSLYLFRMFKTATDGFVDFRITDDKVNINNAEKLDIFSMIYLGVKKLPTIKKNLSVGLYKAKLAIHSAFQHVVNGDFMEHEISAAREHVYNLVNRFNLREWVIRTAPKWIEKYRRRKGDDYTHLLAWA